MAFGERVLLFSFGVIINLLWVVGGGGSVVMSTSDSGTTSECWRVSLNLALGFFWIQASGLRYLLPVVAMLRLNEFYSRILSLFFDVIIRQVLLGLIDQTFCE
jgi:hypothetical protein